MNIDAVDRLFEAIQKDELSNVEYILGKEKIDLECKNIDGYSPLAWSVYHGKDRIVSLLIKKGSKIESKSNNGQTPLLLAAKHGYDHIIVLLLNNEARADIEALDNHKNSPLILASIFARANVVKILLINGANMEAQNNNGKTALHYATINGHTNIVQMIEQYTQLHNRKKNSRNKNDQNKNKTMTQLSATQIKEAEELKMKNEIQLAIKKGFKKWKRSKICLVGEGRAGKTATANTIIGIDYNETKSTIGINQITCDIKQVQNASNGDGTWNQCKKSERELEDAIASMIIESRIAETHNKTNEMNNSVNNGNHNKSKSSKKGFLNFIYGKIGGSSSSKHDVVVEKNNYTMDNNNNNNNINNNNDSLAKYIKFWLNSIAIHTLSYDENDHIKIAPIVIIGTRKDIITDVRAHAKISLLLYETFSNNIAWPFLIENANGITANGITNLVFFPIDNIKGRKDNTVKYLMNTLNHIISESDYVKKEIPLTWLQTVDKLSLVIHDKPCISYEQVGNIAINCGVPYDDIVIMIEFLHEMGFLMWNKDIDLRDIIILDPITYFVIPATNVICKHRPTSGDPTHHLSEHHKTVRKSNNSDWNIMIEKGIVTLKLLKMLLSESKFNIDSIIALMNKFGLIVPILLNNNNNNNNVIIGINNDSSLVAEYLVPSIIPPISPNEFHHNNHINEEEWIHTGYFIFTTDPNLSNKDYIHSSELKSKGFLPKGLFERLICKVVAWGQYTSPSSSSYNSIYKDILITYFGNQRFRLKSYSAFNCLEISMNGSNPLAIIYRLYDLINKLTEECMKNLHCFIAVKYNNNNIINNNFNELMTVIPLARLIESVSMDSNYRPILLSDGKLLSQADVLQYYNPWIKLKALINSSVIIPIISKDALQRIVNHNPNEIDNVLIEWITALECFQINNCRNSQGQGYNDNNNNIDNNNNNNNNNHGKVRLARIFPIMFGDVSQNASLISNLFSDGILDKVPDIIPIMSINKVVELMNENGLQPRSNISQRTIKTIIQELISCLGFGVWTMNESNNESVINVCTEKIVNVVQKVISDEYQAKIIISQLDINNNNNNNNNNNKKDILLTRSSDTIPYPSEKIMNESSRFQIQEWLSAYGLSVYYDIFVANGIDEKVHLLEIRNDTKGNLGTLREILVDIGVEMKPAHTRTFFNALISLQ
eukprot:gene12515-16785_t